MEMATHSSVLAWRIPGTGKPGGLPSMGSHRVGHDWSDLAAAAAAAVHPPLSLLTYVINNSVASTSLLLLFSLSVVSDYLQPHALQHARFPVFHYLPKLPQTHVHWVNDVTQSSHPLSPPSSLALNFSQHQGLSQWVDSLHQAARELELQLQHRSF